MPETTVNDIDNALPAMARLVDTMEAIEPVINKAYPDIVAIIPIIGRLLDAAKGLEPTASKAYPDLIAVLPVLKEIITFIRDEQEGSAHV